VGVGSSGGLSRAPPDQTQQPPGPSTSPCPSVRPLLSHRRRKATSRHPMWPRVGRLHSGWRLLLDGSRLARRKVENEESCAVGPRLGPRRGTRGFAKGDEKLDVLAALLGRNALHGRGKGTRVELAPVVRQIDAAAAQQNRQRGMASLGQMAFFHLELHWPVVWKKHATPWPWAGNLSRSDGAGSAGTGAMDC